MVVIGSVVGTLFMLGLINKREESHNKLDSNKPWYETYDYIVVGGGTAGSVVASRLAEDPSKTVLLLEAGKPQPIISDVPAMQPFVQASEYNWNYEVLPQVYGYQGRVGNKANIPRGKMFGGSSALNNMNYYRENEDYFKLWANISGVPNWKWKHVMPFFLKPENNLDPQLVAEYPDFHQTGGLVSITTQKIDPILKEYLIAANQYGLPFTHYDGRAPFGASFMQKTINGEGVRQSASLGFLESRNQPNLHTMGRSYATKILFDHKKRAIGLEFYKHGIHFSVKVRNEIIVSAGPIESPKLLMNSGIGPEDHLKDFNITVISNLMVGQNLQISIDVDFYFDIKNQSLMESFKPIFDTNKQFLEYYIDKKGPLIYKTSGVTCFKEMAFPGFPGVSNGCSLSRIATIGNNLDDLVKEYKMKDLWREYFRPYLNRTVFNLMPVLRRPQRRGSVRLASTHPFDNPLIDTCEFCEEQDVTDFVETFKRAVHIFLSPHMRQFIEPFKNPIPGCTPCPNDEFCNTYVRCIVTKYTTLPIPMSSCAIGVDPQKGAVVDQYLRVYGVSGLRVIDSSIIPTPSEQGYALTMMVAEYGAHILQTYK